MGATALAIFAFGLAHGLGLSTRLQELNLPDGLAMVARILAFNVGVEIGQLLALSLLVAIGWVGVRAFGHLALARRAAAVALVIVGALASAGIPADTEPGPAPSAPEVRPEPVALPTNDPGGPSRRAGPRTRRPARRDPAAPRRRR